MDDKSNLPSTPRPEYTAALPDIRLIRDLLGGTRVMHREHKKYIPKYKSEPPERYRLRATVASVYGALGRSLSASIGMLFAKPPAQLDAWSPEITAQWENIDGKGTHGNVFAKRHAFDALADGFAAILVDHPPAPAGVVVHAANQATLNLVPRWAAYQRLDILSWIPGVINNVEVPIQVVLRENGGFKRVGKFGVTPALRFRVCTLDEVPDASGVSTWVAKWEVLEETKDATGHTIVTSIDRGPFLQQDGTPFDEIPLAPCYAGRTDAMFTADPGLLDFAWAMLEYWQIASELRWYEKLAAFAQPTLEGQLAGGTQISADGGTVIQPQLQLGPSTYIHLTPGSKFTWAEVSGKSFDGLRASLTAKKQELADLGASFLRPPVRGVETAEAKRLDATAENSTLTTAAQGIEDGINQALQFHARYLGIAAADAPRIQINRDFEGLLMDAQTMTAYVALVNAGFPKRLVLEALQAGGRIADDADLDALELEWESGLLAAQEQARLEAQAHPPTPALPPEPGTADGAT